MSLAEVVAAALTAFLAAVAVTPYLMDAAGLGVMPAPVLVAAVSIGAIVAWSLLSDTRRGAGDLVAWAGVTGVVVWWLLMIAWPAWLPPGSGSDLTHHLLLVDYIERSGHLVHDRTLGGAMGEMAHYTPGAHVMAVLFGAWSGSDGFRAFYPVVAVCTGLTAGFTFLIARRLALPAPFAVIGAMLLLLPYDYFVGAFTHDAFLAQAVCACFTVAAWWALIAWEERPATTTAAVFGLFITAVFLAWPVWTGPPLLVFAALLLRRHVSIAWRIRQLAVVMVPLAAVAGIHAAGRLGWTAIVRTSGAVLQPSIAAAGWAFPVLAALGFAIAIRNRRARVTLAFLLAIAVQAVTLWVLSRANGAETPYMAYKMAYLAIYPLAILAALAIHFPFARTATPVRVAAGWAVATVLLLTIVRPALTAPRAVPVVSLDLYQAGQWMREHVGGGCADYLVGDANTAYWLHLAVLGNPRSAARTAEIDQFEPRRAMGQWIASEGRGFAVADLNLLPDELRPKVQVMAEFGRAAVIRREGAACADP